MNSPGRLHLTPTARSRGLPIQISRRLPISKYLSVGKLIYFKFTFKSKSTMYIYNSLYMKYNKIYFF